MLRISNAAVVRLSLSACLIAGLAIVPCAAQSGPPHVQAELVSTIKSKKAKVGDEVSARTVSALSLPDGTTAPAGSMLIGKVNTVEADDSSHHSAIGLSFDQVKLPDGKSISVPLSIRAAMMPGATATQPKAPQKKDEKGDALSSVPGGPFQTSIRLGDASSSIGSSVQEVTVNPDKRDGASAQTAGKTPGQSAGQPVQALAGTVIGMDGVKLAIGSGGDHVSTFESEHKNLELAKGLQIILTPAQ